MLNYMYAFALGLSIGLKSGPYYEIGNRLFVTALVVYLILTTLIWWRQRRERHD